MYSGEFVFKIYLICRDTPLVVYLFACVYAYVFVNERKRKRKRKRERELE